MEEHNEQKDFLNEKLGMAEIQGRFVSLDELSEDEIDQMLEEARKNEARIRAQIKEILDSNREKTKKRISSFEKEN